MGYEIKLFVGKAGHSGRELKHSTVAELDGDVAYFPALKDKDDNFIYTGRTEIYFAVYGMVDLCCPGHDSNLLKLDWKNKEAKKISWYFYIGDRPVREDCYEDAAKPVPVADVIEALEKDWTDSFANYETGYRRFQWALGFLKEMGTDAEVMLYGY